MSDFVDYIPMNLNDPNLTPHDGKQQRVDPGTYEFEVEKAVFDQSKKGNKVLRVTMKIVSDGPMKGRQMTGSYVINDEEFSRRRMLALVKASQCEVDERGGFSAAKLVGCHLLADVVSHSWDDINAKTGMPETREGTRYEGERPIDFAAEEEHPVQTQVAQAAPTPATPRRSAAAATNGTARPQPPRS